MKNFIKKVDLARYVSNHLSGKNHTIKHRRTVGTFIILLGAAIMRTATHIHMQALEILIDAAGGVFHAIGAIPFVSKFEKDTEPCVGDLCPV